MGRFRYNLSNFRSDANSTSNHLTSQLTLIVNEFNNRFYSKETEKLHTSRFLTFTQGRSEGEGQWGKFPRPRYAGDPTNRISIPNIYYHSAGYCTFIVKGSLNPMGGTAFIVTHTHSLSVHQSAEDASYPTSLIFRR